MFITPSFKKSLIVEQFRGNYLNWPLPQWGFSGPKKPNDETNNANKQNMVKTANWSASQLVEGKSVDYKQA